MPSWSQGLCPRLLLQIMNASLSLKIEATEPGIDNRTSCIYLVLFYGSQSAGEIITQGGVLVQNGQNYCVVSCFGMSTLFISLPVLLKMKYSVQVPPGTICFQVFLTQPVIYPIFSLELLSGLLDVCGLAFWSCDSNPSTNPISQFSPGLAALSVTGLCSEKKQSCRVLWVPVSGA